MHPALPPWSPPLLAALVGLAAIPRCDAAKIEVPLVLFSGQSNMVGLGTSTNDLITAQKATNPNIMVYLDAEGDASRLKKWTTFGPGFGATTSQFGPELLFGRTLADSFPGRKFAFIKVARSGTYLGKAAEWLPPSSNNGTGGTYYAAMMASIDAALKSFDTAFDTSLYAPRWAGFVWLQGEFDAMDATLASQYETNLTNLVKDIRAKAGVPDLPVVLPMIDAQSIWTNNAKIRAADVALTTKLAHVDTVDTKGLATDGIHYKAAGMVAIGQRAALRFLAMKTLSVTTGVAARRPSPSPRFEFGAYDARGRRIENRRQGKADPSGLPAIRPEHHLLHP